jgi:hypothetical protein
MKDKIVSKKDSEGILFVHNVKPSTSANFDGPEGIPIVNNVSPLPSLKILL